MTVESALVTPKLPFYQLRDSVSADDTLLTAFGYANWPTTGTFNDMHKILRRANAMHIMFFGTAAAAILMWLIIPIFIVGALLYLIAIGIISLDYVKDRNSRVLEFDRILTAEHIKGLFSNAEAKKLDTLKGFIFGLGRLELPTP